MIIKGQVSREIRNDSIPNWEWAFGIYKGIIDWKEKEFEKKVKEKMEIELIKT